MAYKLDSYDNSIVIDGFEKGIADDPYSGIADMRCVRTSSIPGEASVNFSTLSVTLGNAGTGTVDSASAGNDTVTVSGSGCANFAVGTAVKFVGGSLPSGIVAGTVYWVTSIASQSAGTATFKISASALGGADINILSDGTGTFNAAAFVMGKPVQRAFNSFSDTTFKYFILDSSGLPWGYSTIAGKWIYVGVNNSNETTNANGNGLVAWHGYLFIFRNDKIDYIQINTIPSGTTSSYGWKTLNTSSGVNTSHYAYVGQDDVVYFCDSSYVGSLQQVAGATFDPTTATTYTYTTTALALPTNDIAQCLAELGVNLLVGGKLNAIYPWNRTTATSFTYPILLAENFITRMITVNTNTYILAGNRGNVYITNGSQANVFKKVPDHISGTVEPYFQWGDLISIRNQLFFGVSALQNSGSAISGNSTIGYGGVWAIDLDTAAIRLSQKLYYDTYSGIATVLLPISITSSATTPAGLGFHVGWDSGSSTYGMDITSTSPYTGSQATIDSDLIPIGTYQKPRETPRIEFKLTKPLVSGESISLKYRTDFSQSYTTIGTDSTTGEFSNNFASVWKNAQWLQIQAVLSSTASTPSYVRLKQIRIRL